ncbi:MAG TPA: hypothetical protein VGE21_06125 [Flavobacteriales bacterium]
MTGAITRAIALVAYGNAFLRQNLGPDELTLHHPVFQFENKVDFRGVKRGWFGRRKEVILAGDPAEWLRQLQANGAQRLILDYASDHTQAPDHQLAGMVGGGGHWFIHSYDGRGSSVWVGREHVTRKDDPERRIWEVNYWLLKQLPQVDLRSSELTHRSQQLREALGAICDFSKEHAPEWWKRNFKPAADVLDGAPFDFAKEHVSKAVPLAFYPEDLQRLFIAASRAWVFGGMGSWNDIGFSEEEVTRRYDQVSAELFSAVNGALVAATNEPWQG